VHPLASLPKTPERPRSAPAAASARPGSSAWRRAGAPLLAILVALAAWQAVVWSGWRPPWVLPAPASVLARLAQDLASGDVLRSSAITLGRAAQGFAIAVAGGTALGIAMSKLGWLRAMLAGLVTGLQTMPSVVWFPLAILVFHLSDAAILFVVVLGAAPSVAVGLLGAVDHVPPHLVRVGRTVGARGLTLFRRVVFPAALPGYVAGLKQGWAFSWRSLMAGELLVMIPGRPSIGSRLHFARELSDIEGLLSWMIVVLAIGVAVDLLVFGRIEERLRRRRGLLEEPSGT
jgi:NitT/TauT family transport system permease protein